MLRAALLPLAVLVTPIALLALARELALRGRAERAARWFAFARRAQLLIGLAPAAWLIAVMRAVREVPPAFWYGVQEDPRSTVAIFLAILTPITLLPALMSVMVHDVASRLETTSFGRRETLERAAWLGGAFVAGALPMGLGAYALANGRVAWAMAGFALGLAAIVACLARSRRGLRLTPHSVTHGPLRDRLFAMAAAAKVPLRQLYVLPVKRLGLANAFAVHGQVVMVTDLLLERLTKPEVDAVLAHEIAHLRRGDPLKLLFARLALIGGPAVLLAASGLVPTLAGVMLGVVAASAISRRIEYATDRESLRLGGDAASLISGLGRLARLSHMPLHWSRWTAWFLTHPSVEDRARALARVAGLGGEEVRARLAGEGETGGHYATGDGPDLEARLFSTPFKHAAQRRNALLLLAIASLVPASIFAEARLLGWAIPRGWLLLAAALAGPAVTIAVLDFLAVQPLHHLRRRLARRHGLSRAPAGEGWSYCGLAPHAEARVYEGFANWDVGFARVTGDAIEFAGDETRFAIPGARLVEVRVVHSLPNWIPTRSVRVLWRDAGGDVHPLRLTPLDGAGLHAIAPAARRLAERVEGLRVRAPSAGFEVAPAEPALPLPPTGEVTSQSPRSTAPVSALASFLIADVILAAILSPLFGLPFGLFGRPGGLEVVGVALLTQVVLLLPAWTYREPADDPGDFEAKRAA